MNLGLQANPLPVTIEVEPVAAQGGLAYSLLAPKAVGLAPRVMIAVMLRITNHSTSTLVFDKLRFSFIGPPFVAETLYTREDLLKKSDPDIPPGDSHKLHFSRMVTISFTAPAPPAVNLRISFSNLEQHANLFRNLVKHENPVSGGAYRLPFRASNLALPGFNAGSSGHRGGGQRFAHDMGAVQWDPGKQEWRGVKPGSNEKTNENQVDWELPVYAMADGVVKEFENNVPDNPNPPDKIAGGGGNYFRILHGTERVSYAHLREGSLNPDLLYVGATVAEGQFLGRMGNSGKSSSCHLHIHALDNTTDAFRPLQFRGGWVVGRSFVDPADLSAPWVKLQGHGLPFDNNAIWPDDALPAVIERRADEEYALTDAFSLAALDANSVVTVFRDADARLRLVTAAVSDSGDEIGFLGDSGELAGRVDEMEAATLGFGTLATAIITAEGRLRVIAWRIADGGALIERRGDSADLAGATDALSLVSLGSGYLATPVRTAEGREKIIIWLVSSDGESVQRQGDSGDNGVECTQLAAATFGLGRLFTALKGADDRLLVEVWNIASDGTSLTRLSDSGAQAGVIGEVRLVAIDAGRVVTAVRTESNRLKLIVWDVDSSGIISRDGDSSDQGDIAEMISITRLTADILVTAVISATGKLKHIAWKIAPDGAVSRLGDSGQQAGDTEFIDVEALDPSRFVTAIRTSSGRLKLIAWSFGDVGERTAMAAVSAPVVLADRASIRPALIEDLDDFSDTSDGSGSAPITPKGARE